MLIKSLSTAEITDPEAEQIDADESANAAIWDDVFESHTGHPSANSALDGTGVTEPSEVPRIQAAHSKAGYRDGISVAKGQFVQAGFDEGYGLGGEVGRAVGWVLGSLEGLSATASTVSTGKKRAYAPSTAESSSAVSEESRQARDSIQKAGEESKELLRKARQELDAGKVFGKEYITEEGVWLWDVEETESGVAVMRDVAMQHPLIIEWNGKVQKLIKEFGIDSSVDPNSSQ
jgi:Essential protein Yae1, N terminal